MPILFAQFVREALDRTRRKRFDMTVADRRRLLEYDWPGNARELRNYAYNAVLDLPRIASGELGTARPALQERVAAFERMIVSEALQQAAGNVAAACGLLKISRQGLYAEDCPARTRPHGTSAKDINPFTRPSGDGGLVPDAGIRTRDLRFTKPLLYQLS